MATEKKLAGLKALITAGSGAIASAAAHLLARDGASVTLMGRRGPALEAVRGDILKHFPEADIRLSVGDGLEEADVRRALDVAAQPDGRLDIIVSTVGGSAFKPLLMMDAETFRHDLDFNIMSAFLAIRYGAPLMSQGGSIVCISSTAAKLPFAYLASYHTAKAGVEGLVRAAAEELGAAGIRVNAVRPGMTRSASTSGMFDTPEVIGRFLPEFPLGRLGAPNDIGEAIRYLAGPESSWVTGQSFAVDGGNELRKNPDLTDVVVQAYGQEVVDLIRKGKSPAD